MDPLGDLEKLRWRVYNHSLGGNTQCVGEGHQGLEYFSDTATRGGAIYVDDAKAIELSGSVQKLFSGLGGHVGSILIECHRRVVDFLKHAGGYSCALRWKGEVPQRYSYQYDFTKTVKYQAY